MSEVTKGFLKELADRLHRIRASDIGAAIIEEAVDQIPIVRRLSGKLLSEKTNEEVAALVRDLNKLSQDQLAEIGVVVGLSSAEIGAVRHHLQQLAFLPSIEAVLEKDNARKPEAFYELTEPWPLWHDFEREYVIERREVDQIITSLWECDLQLVVGEPGAGKSTFLKHVGFKLASKGRCAYFIEMKGCPRERAHDYLFHSIPSRADDEVVVIINNAHRHLDLCKRFVEEHQQRESAKRLILGTNDVKGLEEFGDRNRINIFASDIADQLIDLYLRTRRIDKDNLITKKLKDSLESYKDDLFLLGGRAEKLRSAFRCCKRVRRP